MAAEYFSQAGFELRCAWGLHGLEAAASGSDVVVIVDVLSFSTAVDIALSRGARVYPCQGSYEQARGYAHSLDAILAEKDRTARFSLSPLSLLRLPPGSRLVLPSLNGSTLSLNTGGLPTLTGCLRNYKAVAQAAQKFGRRITVIAAGERWADGSLRPGVEDWLGAGAVLSELKGVPSPEANTAAASFQAAQAAVSSWLRQCGSGIELIERGFAQDVELAAALNVSSIAPLLIDGAYQAGACS